MTETELRLLARAAYYALGPRCHFASPANLLNVLEAMREEIDALRADAMKPEADLTMPDAALRAGIRLNGHFLHGDPAEVVWPAGGLASLEGDRVALCDYWLRATGHDGTDNAHPSYWTGTDQATRMLCVRVEKILDGKDDGRGTTSPPWEPVRRRLLALKAEAEKKAVFLLGGRENSRCSPALVYATRAEAEAAADRLVTRMPRRDFFVYEHALDGSWAGEHGVLVHERFGPGEPDDSE